MSIRIATLSFGTTTRGASSFFWVMTMISPVPGGGVPLMDDNSGGSPLFLSDEFTDPSTFLNTLLLPPSLLLGPGRMMPPVGVTRVPRPLSTTTFPDHLPLPSTTMPDPEPPPPPRMTRRRYRRRGRVVMQTVPRKRLRDEDTCAICLESVLKTSALMLPCHHTFHRLCLFAVLTAPALGSNSMLRCPLCRATLDRYDLAAMGCDVSPRRLALAHRRCQALIQLGSSGSTPQTVAWLVQRCSDTEAVDGFLYNCTLLAVERALCHRRTLVQSLYAQLRAARNRHFDPHEFIRTTVACHVEVLMRTAVVNPEAGPGDL